MRKKILKADVPAELWPGQSMELLKDLHLLTRQGHLNADARRKLKQINHFFGFLEPALKDIYDRYEDPVLVDAGSGNAYLGFILYDLFLSKHEKGTVINIDSRQEFLEKCSSRAKEYGFSRMEFVHSTLREYEVKDRVHLLTALHACDTATDDAIIQAIQNKIDHVFLVPCCQAEVSRLLGEQKDMPLEWQSVCQWPLHRREFGAHLTNVIRALMLKSFGYKITVTEMTPWEHTPKCELIIGRKVHAEHFPSRNQLLQLLETLNIRPYLAQALLA